MAVPRWVGDTPGPFVCCEAYAPIADDQHGIERSEPQMAPTEGIAGDDQQPVVAAGTQSGDRAHGVTAESVGDEPLSLAGCVEVAADLPSELTIDHAIRKPGEDRAGTKKASSGAMRGGQRCGSTDDAEMRLRLQSMNAASNRVVIHADG